MCYYNGVRVPYNEYIRLLEIERQIEQQDLLKPLISGFDYDKCLVIKPSPGGTWNYATMEWGFIPSHLKNRAAVNNFRFGYTDASGQFHPPLTTLNATGEELLKPGKMFREAAMERRCLVLSSGFYEWRHVFPTGKKGQPLKTAIKYPYHITLRGKRYFFMAGIWQPWTDKETGETTDTFAIVTTAANPLMQKVHNSKKRMPVILPEQLAGEWISDPLPEERITAIAMNQYPAHEMEACTIQKNFRTAANPEEAFTYKDLEELMV